MSRRLPGMGDTPLHVALLDLGCKNNIVRCLLKRGLRDRAARHDHRRRAGGPEPRTA